MMFISVIIPVYNSEKYLDECVDSVLTQNYTNFELILVDDGSKDLSGEICDRYAREDLRVKVIHKQNGGQSTARNAGIRVACGDYVVFLDSDDIISNNNFFEKLCIRFESKPDILIYKYCKYYGKEHISNCNIDMSECDGLGKDEILHKLVSKDAFFCSCWSKAVKRSILSNNNILFDESLCCEDMDWFYSVLEKTKNISVLDESFIYYRQRNNSVTSSFNDKSLIGYIHTLNKWKKIFAIKPDGFEKEALLSSLAKLYCNLLISYSRNSEKAKEYKKEIFALRSLLVYDLNPRTKTIHKFSKFFGLSLTCIFLRFVDSVLRS